MEIGSLKKIIELTEKYKGDYIGPLERFFIDTKFPKLTLFFKLVKDGKAKTDDEASFLLSLPTSYSGEYIKLKTEFTERAYHLLFFIDTRKVPRSFMWKKYIPGFKKVVGAELIFFMGLDPAPIDLVKSGYEDLKGIKFSDKRIFPLFNLMRYSTNIHDMPGVLNYADQVRETLKICNDEFESELMHIELQQIITKSEGERFKHKRKALNYLKKIKKLFDRTPTESIQYSYLQSSIILGNIYDNRNLVVNATRVSDEWLDKQGLAASKLFYAQNSQFRMEAELRLRDYEKGKEDMIIGIAGYIQGSPDWLSILSNFFLLSMYTRNYEKALEIYYQVLKHEAFPKLNLDVKERWKYFEPYLNFVIADDFVKENMDLLSFLNEISYYTEHKSDNNIPILIGQVISMVDMGELKKLADRTNYLDNYIKQYVDKKNFKRTYIFLKILLKLFQNKFDPFKTEKQTATQFKKLAFIPENKLKDCDALEVIPYDHLWPMLLERLKAKLS
jgi:hypothetical protein